MLMVWYVKTPFLTRFEFSTPDLRRPYLMCICIRVFVCAYDASPHASLRPARVPVVLRDALCVNVPDE